MKKRGFCLQSHSRRKIRRCIETSCWLYIAWRLKETHIRFQSELMIAHCPSLSWKMFMISASRAHRLIYRLSVIGDRGRSPSIRDGLRYRHHSLPCAQHAPNTAFRPFLCRRPAVRRKPLHPAMRRVCVAIRHSFSYPGLRPIR